MPDSLTKLVEISAFEAPLYQLVIVFMLFVFGPKLLDRILAYSKLAQTKKLLSIIQEIDAVHADSEKEKETLSSIKREMLNKIASEPLLRNAFREVKDFISTFPITSIFIVTMTVVFVQAVAAGAFSLLSGWESLLLLLSMLPLLVLLMLFDVALERLSHWLGRKARVFLDRRFEEKRSRDALENSAMHRDALRIIVEGMKAQISFSNEQMLTDRSTLEKMIEIEEKAREDGVIDGKIRLELIEVKAKAMSQVDQFEKTVSRYEDQINLCDEMIQIDRDMPEYSSLLDEAYHVQELCREAIRLVELDKAQVEQMIGILDSLFEMDDVAHRTWIPI